MSSAELLSFTKAQLEVAAGLGIRVAVAESLTGGMLADAFVSVPGASRVFSGGIVAYDSWLKGSLLGVNEGLLQREGPVHPQVAQQMARGVRHACAVARAPLGEVSVADIGLSTTGVAGPDRDPATGQPAGTVWVGVSSRLGERAVLLQVSGSRADIRAQSVRAALDECAAELTALGEIHAKVL